MPTKPLLSLLLNSLYLYQRTLSPDHGVTRILFPAGVCRFNPTCSEYMIEAINQHGWRGVVTGLRRLIHCHPYSRS